jgi:gluconolactonase
VTAFDPLHPPWNIAAADPYEVLDERFRSYVLSNSPLILLGEGFGWLEGPVWFADHACLLVSDIPNDRLVRFSPRGGFEVFQTPSGFCNGNTRDRQGRLLSCSHRQRAVLRTEWDGTRTTVADRYRGKRLNSPNDIVCRSDGSLYFTDPIYGISTDYEGGKQTPELPPSVYRFDPARGELRCIADDFEGPNGLAFSPDERLLYIAETGRQFAQDPVRHIRVFDVDPAGDLSGGRIFYTVTPGYADGFRIDVDGNLWCSSAEGVQCISPAGAKLGTIRTPHQVSNLTFGGRDRAQLFICASHSLYTVFTNQRGAQWP